LTRPTKKISNFLPIIVSNRLPVKIEAVDGDWQIKPGTGGLVTALAPVLKNSKGTWIGWPGAPVNSKIKQLLKHNAAKIGYDLHTVNLSEDEIKGYYRGFSNEAIWPLFHDLLDQCNFETKHWETYQTVNYKFAAAVAAKITGENFIWVQDYHLMLVGHFLNEMGFANRTAFFLHIPFPPKDIFIRLPWRHEILEALLSYRLVGFQTERDRRNFIHCVRHLIPTAHVSHHKKYPYIRYNNQITRIGSFPISIDFKHFNDDAASNEVADAAWFIHERYPDQKIILGVDRLDYTKGIPHRLLAFENCLERYPELKEKITLVQVVVPSRTNVVEYQQMKSQIDEMVGRISGRFTRRGWVPIHYIYGTLSRTELLGYYKAAEIALITPLKDGMNLVAKEYCACCVDNTGMLILSEFAGAADRLKNGAILVNPYNLEEVADAIHRACYTDLEEQKMRMKIMRGDINRHNVFKWVDQFISSFYFQSDSAPQSNSTTDSHIPAITNK
jgi:trehalose 6-phosphate synthase/phosphatase